jgi:hypothetical protein
VVTRWLHENLPLQGSESETTTLFETCCSGLQETCTGYEPAAGLSQEVLVYDSGINFSAFQHSKRNCFGIRQVTQSLSEAAGTPL